METMGWRLLLAALLLSGVLADKDYVQNQDSLSKRLLAGYNKDIKPDHKVNVTVNVFVRNIKKIDMKEGSMEYQLTFRQKWQDSRLVYADKIDFLTLIPGAEKSIWVPDTFFRNELEANVHNALVPNEYLRLYPNGEVLYSTRLTLKTTCSMDLKNYPFDSQTCGFQVASYGLTKEDIEYIWKDDDPVQIAKELHLPEYYLIVKVAVAVTSTCDVMTATGAYSCISAAFTFQRSSGHTVTTIMVPAFMAVSVSWISFFISPTELTSRILVGLGALIQSSIFSFVINTFQLPVKAYTKAIDVFLGVSILFIFLSLVETMVVSLFFKNEEEKRSSGFLNNMRTGSLSTRVDLVSRILFPALFALFLAIYCLSY